MRQGLLTYQNAADGNSTLTPGQIKQMDPLGIGEDPAVLSLLQNYPLPNDPTLGDGLNTSGYRFAANEKRKFDTYIARLDYNLTADGRHTLFWRGDLQNDNQVGPCVLSGSNCAPLSLTDWLNTSAQQGQTGGAAAGGFPATPSSDAFAISWGMDSSMLTPYAHAIDFSISRELSKDLILDLSYAGRFWRRLPEQEDVAMPRNFDQV